MKRIGVGLLGLGTVGSGVYKALERNQDVIWKRTELLPEVRRILVRNPQKERGIEGVKSLLTTDFEAVLDAGVEVVVEAIGGVEPARSYIRRAISAGCHVVTANKELIAKHGLELEELARRHGVRLLYEAAVGGGIPVLGTLQHLLKTNRIDRITGILNGTTNYILTEMTQRGVSFATALEEAQRLGYAEADPVSDVEGFDAAFKLAILCRLAFETVIAPEEIPREGIRDILPEELSLARRMGYAVKLLAHAEQYGEQGPVSLQVGPALLPLSHPLAAVDGVYNAIHLQGDVVQDVTLVGQGAGEQPTASAVVEDLCNAFLLPASGKPGFSNPLLLPEGEGGVRFVLMETGPLSADVPPGWLRERLEGIGLTVEDMVVETGERGSWVGMVLRRWEPAFSTVLLAEWRMEVKRIVIRPVVGVKAALSRKEEAKIMG